jgi:hypothetical protein
MPKALANFSPGLSQPWAVKISHHSFGTLKEFGLHKPNAFSVFLILYISFPRVEATLG